MVDSIALRSQLLSIHAVVIGIDNYPHVAKLRGAVRDADSIVDYLRTDLLVPETQITSLRNEKATRSEIIAAIDGLRQNPKIKAFDPILIYFSGHGCEKDSPLAKIGNYKGKTQCLVPWDVGCKSDEGLISAIPDYTLAALLYGLAQAKGNNVVVILDACHSASSTRGLRPSYYEDYNVESVGISENTSAPSLIMTPMAFDSHQARLISPNEIPPIQLDPDMEILRSKFSDDFGSVDQVSLWNSHGTTSEIHLQQLPTPMVPNFAVSTRSHVLLAACDHSEVAYESLSSGTGCFTTALLEQLRSNSLERFTYRMCFENFPSVNAPNQQSPVCEGDIDRFFFSLRIMVDHHTCIPVHLSNDNSGLWYLGTGNAQGVIPNSKFHLYTYDTSKEQTCQTPLVTFSVSPIGKNPCRSICLFEVNTQVPRFAFARLVERGQGHMFQVYLTDAARSRLDTRKIFQPQHGIVPAYSRQDAQLVLNVDAHNDITFELIRHGFHSRRRLLPARVSPDSSSIQRILFSMAQWDWHVSRRPDNQKKLVNLVMYKLEESEPRRIWSENEHTEELILPLTNDLYGFEVTSLCSRGLHLYLFYYSTEGQSIRPLFLPVCGPGMISAPLDPREKLNIGYGNDDALPGAILFRNKSDIGYFRVFATTCPGNFDSITQKSTFEPMVSGQPNQPAWDLDGFNDGLMIGNLTRPPTAEG
ncbi:unnamed protein product [Rhizoctonia solani]|uniref:Peptidase C14 caspase domain-containing protein n=1 Tax=Rhizoctonia solani TaxID=456999 RepID=A0A8H2W6H3_9AGAM|nr:unnamed protein product [Rhizoctonia solani]